MTTYKILYTIIRDKLMLLLLTVACSVGASSAYSQDHFMKVITPQDAYFNRGSLQVGVQNDTLVFLQSGYYQGDSSDYFTSYLTWYSSQGDLLHRVDLGGFDNLAKILVDGDRVLVLGGFSRVQDSVDLISLTRGEIDHRLLIYDPYRQAGEQRIACLIKHGKRYVITSSLESLAHRRASPAYPHVTVVFEDLSDVDTTFSLPLDYGIIPEAASVHDSTIVLFFQNSNIANPYGPRPDGYLQQQGFYTIDIKGEVLDSFAYSRSDFGGDEISFFPDARNGVQIAKITPEGLRVTVGSEADALDRAFVFDANNTMIAKYTLPFAPVRSSFFAFDVLPDSTIVMLSTWYDYYNVYAGFAQGINGTRLQRMDLQGNLLMEKRFGLVDPGTITVLEALGVNHLDDNRLVLLAGAQRPGPSPLDSSVHKRQDNILIVVDSLGCSDEDRCNDGALVEPHDTLYAYDQLTMRHKLWEVVVDGDTTFYSFGQDTLTGYDGAGPFVARPLQVSTGAREHVEMHRDSLLYYWARTGKVWLAPYNVGSYEPDDRIEMMVLCQIQWVVELELTTEEVDHVDKILWVSISTSSSLG